MAVQTVIAAEWRMFITDWTHSWSRYVHISFLQLLTLWFKVMLSLHLLFGC